MKQTDSPPLFPEVFARDADPRLVNYPLPSSTEARGRVSILKGYPAENFIPLTSGGVAINGADTQSLFKMLSVVAKASEAGQIRSYDAAYAQDIGGYPQGALVRDKNNIAQLYYSLVDDNMTDPVQDRAQTAQAKSWANVNLYGGNASASGGPKLPVRMIGSTLDAYDETFFLNEKAELMVKISQQQQWARNQQQQARLSQRLMAAAQKQGITL
ncbi:hypothetical protein GS501_04875 [Saccharibacter sp. 17.LH.SD]|uniref:hypothetical protein n=1 Tax=Saccharibacter sp. 17.LH.SD TaxID=2689393 RepID=UPI00136F6550|nr:hypothetical protein [Saccharibacter sp. 17.LH.SD]MXV44380.1 hypothetical protein [Saccharibacter sp. 17.LH.SD]